MASYPNKPLRWTLLALRVIVGAVFLYGGYVKFQAPWALFAMSIDSYHLLPFWMLEPMARTLPLAECALGLWLMVGFWQRVPSVLVSLLLMVFFAAMVHAKIAGQQIDCGCFGPGDPISKWTLLRDGSLLTASLAVTWFSFRGSSRQA
jgi:uncharacterized membrane protein YphA (DoxX/SURF4 family)